jgi:hypothetical protein
MQVGKSSTSLNTQTQEVKLSTAPSNLKLWLKKKASRSKSTTPTMVFSPPLNSRTTVTIKELNTHLVWLGQSIKMALPSAI